MSNPKEGGEKYTSGHTVQSLASYVLRICELIHDEPVEKGYERDIWQMNLDSNKQQLFREIGEIDIHPIHKLGLLVFAHRRIFSSTVISHIGRRLKK